jgi:hypothetical protein
VTTVGYCASCGTLPDAPTLRRADGGSVTTSIASEHSPTCEFYEPPPMSRSTGGPTIASGPATGTPPELLAARRAGR